MWATYKSEIMEREMDEKDFLKNFYERNRAQHEGEQAGRPCSLGSMNRIEETPNSIQLHYSYKQPYNLFSP